MKKLNYLWRVIATGICFFTFGFGALIISSLVFPLQALMIKNKAKRKDRGAPQGCVERIEQGIPRRDKG